jgi:hypothetical protein
VKVRRKFLPIIEIPDYAGIRVFQEGQDTKKRGFAAAVGTLQHIGASAGKGERAIPEDRIPVIGLAYVGYFQF